jgi:thioredoxin 1
MKWLFSFILIASSLTGKVLEVTEANFNTLVQSEPLFIAGIFLEGCYPCIRAHKTLEALSHSYGDTISFGIIDYDTHSEFSEELGVEGFPALFFYKDGVLVMTHFGPISETALKSLIDSFKAINN